MGHLYVNQPTTSLTRPKITLNSKSWLTARGLEMVRETLIMC